MCMQNLFILILKKWLLLLESFRICCHCFYFVLVFTCKGENSNPNFSLYIHNDDHCPNMKPFSILPVMASREVRQRLPWLHDPGCNTSNESFFNFQICQMRYIFIKMSFRALLKQQSLVYSLNECSRVTGRGLGRGGVHVIAMELLQKWVLLSVISNGLLCKRRSKWIMERKRWNRDEMNHERPCVAVPLLWRKALQAGIQVSFECSSLLSGPPFLVSFCTFLIQQFSGFTSFDFQTKAHCYVCRITVVGVGFRVSSENNFSDI